MKIKTRIAAALLAVTAAAGISATPAFAFYKSGGCSTTAGTLTVTNYSKGSGQEYHIYAKVTNTKQYNGIKIFLAGSQIATGSGSKELYYYKSNPTASYTTTVYFYDKDPDGGLKQCSYVS